MGGGGGGFLGNLIEPVSDIIAATTGFGQFIPLINAGETAATDIASGQSIGKSLGQGALSGGEALAGQEALGAVGVGSGNTAFNSALGITGDNPAGTGLPDIGGGISNLFSSSGLAPGAFGPGVDTSGTGDTALGVNPPGGGGLGTGITGAANVPSGGTTVGGAGSSAGSVAAPASVGGSGPDLTQAADASIANANNIAGNVGASVTPPASGTGAPSSGGSIGSFLSNLFGGGASNASPTAGIDSSSIASPQALGAISSGDASAFPAGPTTPAQGASDNSILQQFAGGTGAADAAASTASATAAPAVSATGTAAPNSGASFIKSLFDGQSGTTGDAFKNFLSSNANLAIPAGILGYDALAGNKLPKGTNELRTEAGNLATQGQNLEKYIQSGTLPPGLQGAVQQNLAAQQASIRSQYASRGMSGSSAEQQDLANAATQAQAQSAELAMNLLQTGISETGQSAGIYENLIKEIQGSDQGLQSALAAFSAAAAGGGQGGQTLKINVGQGNA